MRNISKHNRQGITTVEVVVSTLLVGTVVVGSLNLLGASVQSQQAMEEYLVGPLLAEQLLTEIKAQAYVEPEETGAPHYGINTGEITTSRAAWDDVDDYNSWNASPPQLKDGTVLSQYGDWTRRVDTWWAKTSDGEWTIAHQGIKGIRVRAIYREGDPAEQTYTRYAFRSEWGALEQAPTMDKIVVSEVTADLDLGGGVTSWSTHLLNHVEDPN